MIGHSSRDTARGLWPGSERITPTSYRVLHRVLTNCAHCVKSTAVDRLKLVRLGRCAMIGDPTSCLLGLLFSRSLASVIRMKTKSPTAI